MTRSHAALAALTLALVACGGDKAHDSCVPGTTDTASACSTGGGGGGGTTTPVQTAPLLADGSTSTGESFQFVARSVVGENNAGSFAFSAFGSDVTNALTVGVQSGSGPGTWTLTDGEGDSPAAYTDFRWGLENGGFVSIGGTVTITGWQPTTMGPAPAHLATGSFAIQLTNSPDPTDPAPVPLTLDLTGTFEGITLIDGT